MVILGAARSGISCARLLCRKGARVILTDKKDTAEIRQLLTPLEHAGLETVLGNHPLSLLKGADFLVISPGIPSDVSIVLHARKKHIPVWSEIEVAFRFLPCPLIAVSGTNGKTTTTSLLGEIFKKSGRKTFVCGNIGLPVSEIAPKATPEAFVVAEISSFQLENISSFKPYVSVMLNITSDHLDRYPTFAAYKKAKKNMYRYQDKHDYAVLNYDDQEVRTLEKDITAHSVFFSRKKKLSTGVWVDQGTIWSSFGGKKERIIPVRDIALPGPHNLENTLAAVVCAKIAGVGNNDIVSVLTTFAGVEHRLELVRTLGKVKFVNDSKATNVDSVVKALESFANSILLIAGGRDKGSPYYPLKELVQKKVKALIVLGEAAERMVMQLGDVTSTYRVATLQEAVRLGAQLARAGDIVLLSPACASFDMFKNYEQRGKLFRKYVREL